MMAAGAESVPDSIADLTAISRMPADLRRVERLFRNTVEGASIGIAYANIDGSFRHCNRAFCVLLGYAPEELVGKAIASLTHPDDVTATADGLERLWRGEVTHLDVEKRYRRKNGTWLWVRVTTSLVCDSSDQPECSVEFLRDISVRMEMAAALMQNRTLLATVIAELPLALVACGVAGEVTHFNRAAVQLFGTPPDQGDGSAASGPYPSCERIHPADSATPITRDAHPLVCALRGEVLSDVEYTIVRPDGAARTVLASAQQLVGPAGQMLGALAVVQDITERRIAEHELERVHRELLVASRQAGMAEVATNVLHNVGNVLNSVNVSANLVADRTKKSKCAGVARVAALLAEHSGDLAGFMSGNQGRHIPAFLRELAQDLVTERDAAVAELTALRRNVEHIKEIVAMQQAYARRGGVVDTVDVRDLVEDSLRMNEGAMSRHGVAIVRDYEEAVAIQVDKHKVLQILVNLIRNAKYACDEAVVSEKRVTLKVRSGNDAVQISVIDTGIGIPAENLDRIFNHGFTTRKEGHGFGLHSSCLAAKELGGSLQAASAGPGLGATFTLTLPRTDSESPRVG